MWPSAALKVKLNTVDPMRMNITKMVSFVAFSIACIKSELFRRRRDAAMISAPTAPMAPPSVGVAIPRKMVPSTRNIKINGGMSTKVTRSASRDSKPSRATRLTIASTSAVKDAIATEKMTTSSPGAAPSRPVMGLTSASWLIAQA